MKTPIVPAGVVLEPAPSRLQCLVRLLNTNKTSWAGLVLLAIILLMTALAPLLATHDPIAQDILAQLQGPTAAHWLGTDEYGRDTWSRLLYGARASLGISAAATLIDVLLAFPSLILGLIVVAMLGPSMANIVIAIAITSIPPFARIARAPTIALKERDFIEACRALGYSDARTVLLHVVPNISAEIVVMISLWLATAIRTEASLAFIGLGLKPPTPTWGGMIRSGFENILDSAWLAVAPSIAILLVTFALNLLGDGLRDAVDPKLKNEA
jgi:peptide/nickel transport system permease protein